MTPEIEARFWSKVDKTATCWLWTSTLRTGYGKVHYRLDGVRHQLSAHRVAWTLLRGPIPDGMELDHLCKVRHCVNPDHLEPVSQYENNMRSDSPVAINARRETCVHGHPFTEANTRIDYRGRRRCRECDKANAAKQRAKARANEGTTP